MSDIVKYSKLKQVETALKESEIRLNAIIETAVDGIITINKKGIIESMNSAAAKLFMYSPSEVIGKNIKILMPEPNRSKHDAYLRHYHKTGEKKIIGTGREVMGLRKDGTTFPFKLGVSEVKLTNRTIYTGIIHDLTEERRSKNELIQLNEQLESKVKSRTEELAHVIEELQHINKNKEAEIAKRKQIEEEVNRALSREMELGELKSRFVSMASHEFRTPLAGILSSTELIELSNGQEHQEKRLKYLKRIRESVQGLTDILNDFLSIGKLQEGKISYNPMKFDLTKLSKEVIEDIDSIKKKDQTILYEYTGEKEIYQDMHILKNILVNLLSNAVKYSPEGGEICFRSKTDKTHVSISIEDTGIGIPKNAQKHLFERFFRAKNVTNIQGTGLGLNIVKQYLELMGGSITFKSVENKGTTFKILFPKQYDIDTITK